MGLDINTFSDFFNFIIAWFPKFIHNNFPIFPFHYVALVLLLSGLFVISTILTALRHWRPISFFHFATIFKPIVFYTFNVEIHCTEIISNFFSKLTKNSSRKDDETQNFAKNSDPTRQLSSSSSHSHSKKKKPLFISFSKKKKHLTLFTFSVGEVLVIILYLILNILFGGYGFMVAWNTTWMWYKPSVYFGPFLKVIAQLLLINFTLVLAPVSRNSIWRIIFGISFERALFYHKWIGIFTISLVSIHGVVYAVWCYFDDYRKWYYIFLPFFYGSGYVLPGFLSGVAFIALGCFSISFIRRKFFEIFLATHVFLTVFGVIAACLHNYLVAVHTSFALVLWGIDLIIRFSMIGHYRFKIVKAEKCLGSSTTDTWIRIHLKQRDTLKFSTDNPDQKSEEFDEDQQKLLPDSKFSRERISSYVKFWWRKMSTFRFEAGQWAFLSIPSVSPIEFHPFTIASCPHDRTLQFCIKILPQAGSFTDRLLQKLNKLKGTTAVLEGPYGVASVDETKYENLVLVTGGIGVCPGISILAENVFEAKEKLELEETARNDVGYQKKIKKNKLKKKKILFIWSARSPSVFMNFKNTLLESLSLGDCKNLKDYLEVHMELYCSKNIAKYKKDLDSGIVDEKLLPFIKFGQRPNVKEIMREFLKGIPKSQNVGVLTCGPNELMRDTEIAAYDLNSILIPRIHFHSESYLF